MKQWEKKEVSKEVVKEIHQRYGCDLLTSSILARRAITTGKDILYYLEDDIRYLHSPFLFNTMEDAVDRILNAKDEGEKVLIFGDRDVDGMTSTALLYQYLTEIGLDVQWKVPHGDDPYGLTIEAVNSFAAEYGTLIITVDCGISNIEEIAHAATLGIDTIVVDHHNAPEELPEAIIVNPKAPNSGYPFLDISGCAVAYKLVTALRFAQTELYKQEICLLNVRPVNEAFIIEGLKVQNMVEKDQIAETLIPGVVSIQETRLISFLRGQQIFVWDAGIQQKMLQKIFGLGVEFNMLDIRPEISTLLPSLANISLLRLKTMSRIAHYQETPSTELDAFFNIFVTYVQKKNNDSKNQIREAQDLQLVAIAAIADIMPLQNENRIMIKQGIASINKGNSRPGISELLVRQNLIGKHLSSTDISWNLVPVLNAAGRLGQAELGVELLTSTDQKQRDMLADKIVQLNQDRKQLGTDIWPIAEKAAYESIEKFDNKLVVVADERVNRGVTGIIASRLVQAFKVPAMVITFFEDGTAGGSIRSTRGFNVTSLLDSLSDLFINHGGHNFAAGFSFPQEKFGEFMARLERLTSIIELSEKCEDDIINIDAEIPHQYMVPDIINLLDTFEPYGEGNKPLKLLIKNTVIQSADIMGKTEKLHLKLTLNCGKNKWPALYWNSGQRLNTDFKVGDKVDVVFQLSRNTFNGKETPQIIIEDCEKTK
jgi:single-stranded-DNA-specific exonuclease